jgi:hypothetical protein
MYYKMCFICCSEYIVRRSTSLTLQPFRFASPLLTEISLRNLTSNVSLLAMLQPLPTRIDFHPVSVTDDSGLELFKQLPGLLDVQERVTCERNICRYICIWSPHLHETPLGTPHARRPHPHPLCS